MSRFQQIIVPKRRLADEVYAQILSAITEGAIPPSERIVQEKLAADFQISRTPVREALLRLEQEGILITVGSGGFMVRQVADDEAREIYAARQAIEGHSARVLALELDAARLDRIRSVIEAQESRKITTAGEYYDANKAIHRSFVEQTGNRYLLEMFDSMWNRSVSFHIFTTTMSESYLKASLREHAKLLDAVRKGDADAAAQAMRSHIDDGLELQLQAMSVARSLNNRT
ncbi:hypothetical protein A9174_34700 (plasmid) [Mesorhizobium loti NZP2037]|nr:GntR family transcriptional regulator [Mesorhizobium loti]ANN62058.1 hypothetical protein A9174_34700 [Mesorhizobium loti NZP2037]